ncbi:peptidyl-prolyl cis-trans isomerase [Philodulcilactobacillus myokoensis]|uniref:Peptidyl-prolyl cis-trans isomerase n=1 Tax=Philodulcilactobacillus myokoensis TaxID=2929573 RepID=A0A9W6ESF4_9LACO|nr:peptidylprolyl isomerase [Philodulcilactobacillus myokoensis]GLB46715.1 peptidyl-prolyl cis-trans isomerase [Philodulcilactobacillus myokoensis]
MNTYPQLSLNNQNGPKATINTNLGSIKIQLFPKHAPKTVENFRELSNAGYYDHSNFHRVIKDFMIQGGDPTGTGSGGESIWNHPFEDEFSSELYNLRGALSMANAGPNTNGSQFFIVQNKTVNDKLIKQMKDAAFPKDIIEAYHKMGGAPWLDFRHTVFGQVIEGMDVVDKIAEIPVDNDDRPKKDVIIKNIKIK